MPTRGTAGPSGRFDQIADLFASFRPVVIRRMFGGAGIYADGLMFGLVIGEAIYLKTDAEGAEAFVKEGCGPFSFATANGRQTVTSFWRMPDRLFDDADELARWSETALTAARAARARKAGGRRACSSEAGGA